MAWFWFVILVAVVCGFIGVLVHGLIWLLIIGALLFVGALLVLGRRRAAKPGRRGRP